MILCFQCEDLSKIFLVSKFEMNWPNIKLILTCCALLHHQKFISFVFLYELLMSFETCFRNFLQLHYGVIRAVFVLSC